MKKERIILFPGSEVQSAVSDDSSQIQLTEFVPGGIYRIGRPSNGHYRFVSPYIEQNRLNAAESDDFMAIEGSIVKVVSILRMACGKKIAVLRHYQDKLFLGEFEKIFAFLNWSITSLEIVTLNLETKRTLEIAPTNQI